VDSTMVRVWYFRPGIRERVEALLAAQPFGRILSDDECARLGVLFPDRRYGETIFLMHAGEILAPSFMGQTAAKAMHGYHPEDADSDTILLSNYAPGPARSIRDIGPLVVRELAALAELRPAAAGAGGHAGSGEGA
jgi:hypothetical protein